MASIPMVLQRIRRARRDAREPPPPSRFDAYRDEYETALLAARDLADEEALDDVATWAVEWTERERHLPDPETFRTHTRRILGARGIEVPADSPLADDG